MIRGRSAATPAVSSGINDETAPKWSIITYHFPKLGKRKAVKVTWYDGGKKPDPALARQKELPGNGSILIGSKDSLYIPMYWGKGTFLSGATVADHKDVPETIEKPADFNRHHYLEWIGACKGGKPAWSSFDYAGPMTDRVWVTDRAGNARRIHERAHDMQWITHEVWRPGHRSVLFVDWPNGLGEIDLTTGEVRPITEFPVWHGAPDATGTRLICDTNFPDRGLHLLDLTGQAPARFQTEPKASSQGAHWADPFPYNDGPVKVYAPQHTHPHPRFSPDGAQTIFTSDRSGHEQEYVATLG